MYYWEVVLCSLVSITMYEVVILVCYFVLRLVLLTDMYTDVEHMSSYIR